MISLFRPQEKNKTWPDGVNVDYQVHEADPELGRPHRMMSVVISMPDGEETVMVRKLDRWTRTWDVVDAMVTEWRAQR